MVWFKVDDVLPFHARVIEAGNAAIGLWVRAGAWSSGQLTDGFIPTAIAKQLGSAREIRRLVDVGLWVVEAGGYRFHAWAEDGTGMKRQPTRAEVEAKRRGETERKAAWRAAREARAAEDAVPAPVPTGQTVGRTRLSQQVSAHPDPTRPDPTPLPSEGGSASAPPPVEKPGDRPAPHCPKHPGGTDRPCRACGDARRAHDAWTPPPAAARPPAWNPETHCGHGQLRGACDACEQDARDATKVILGPWGAA